MSDRPRTVPEHLARVTALLHELHIAVYEMQLMVDVSMRRLPAPRAAPERRADLTVAHLPSEKVARRARMQPMGLIEWFGAILSADDASRLSGYKASTLTQMRTQKEAAKHEPPPTCIRDGALMYPEQPFKEWVSRRGVGPALRDDNGDPIPGAIGGPTLQLIDQRGAAVRQRRRA